MNNGSLIQLPSWTSYAALALVIISNVAGNLLLKIGATTDQTSGRLFGVISWQTLAGVACFASGVLVYAWVLSRFQLHLAQIVVSIQYVLVIVLASFLLGEVISLKTWIGILFVAFGLLLCAS